MNRETILEEFSQCLKHAREAGFVPMLEIGRPAPKKQAISLGAIYLRPLDGSDLETCSCCTDLYEPSYRSKIVENYLPMNWCKKCRARFVEGEPVANILHTEEAARSVRGVIQKIAKSEARVRAMLIRMLPDWMHEKIPAAIVVIDRRSSNGRKAKV